VHVQECRAQRHAQTEAEDVAAQVVEVAQEVVEPTGIAVLVGAVHRVVGQISHAGVCCCLSGRFVRREGVSGGQAAVEQLASLYLVHALLGSYVVVTICG
jgi:hypothetical protein